MYRIGKEEIKAVEKVIKSKELFRVKSGKLSECDKFEKELAKKIGTEYALLLNGGGTSALICGLVGLDIGPGDEVLIPSYTFMATATAVLMVGAIPVIGALLGSEISEESCRKILYLNAMKILKTFL